MKTIKNSNPKGVVYTCITGNYDDIVNHYYVDSNWHYICFTDDPPPNQQDYIWEFLPLSFKKMDNVRNHRWHKLHPHLLFPEYQKSLYIDANLDILTRAVFDDVEKQIIQGQIISIAPHFCHNNIYEEFNACAQYGKDSADVMEKQKKLFKESKFNGNYINGRFFEANIMYREHHNEQLIIINNDWWWWISHYSYRDQLSLTYVLWKHNISVPLLTNKTYRKGGRVNYNYGENHLNLPEAKNKIALMNHKLATLENDIFTLKVLLEQKEQLIKSLLGSRSWRITRPLRQIDGVIRDFHNPRFLLVALAQRVYGVIPLPAQIKTQITNFVFTHFDTFFKGTDPYERWLDSIRVPPQTKVT